MASGSHEEPLNYTPKELAKRWGITEVTLDRHIREGTVPSFKVGHLRRIPRTAVEAYERKQLRAGAGDAARRQEVGLQRQARQAARIAERAAQYAAEAAERAAEGNRNAKRATAKRVTAKPATAKVATNKGGAAPRLKALRLEPDGDR